MIAEDRATEADKYSLYTTACEDDDTVVARVLEWPGLIGVGHSSEEAVRLLREIIADALAVADDDGLPVPAPLRGYSGSLSIRLPRSLHQALAYRAQLEGLSLNATVSYLLAQALAVPLHPPRRRQARAAKEAAKSG